jgi:hypothetical protein
MRHDPSPLPWIECALGRAGLFAGRTLRQRKPEIKRKILAKLEETSERQCDAFQNLPGPLGSTMTKVATHLL